MFVCLPFAWGYTGEEYAHDPRITFINFDDVLCTKDICAIGTKLESYYQDNNHLSKLGATKLAKNLSDVLLRTVV